MSPSKRWRPWKVIYPTEGRYFAYWPQPLSIYACLPISMPLFSDDQYIAREPRRFSQESPDFTEQFLQYWSLGKPAVVTGVKQQGVWNPQYFIKAYGSTPVKLENCETGEVKDSTVGEFFLTFFTSDSLSYIWKIKANFFSFCYRGLWTWLSFGLLQDWPPQQHFRDVFPELFKDFQDTSPCPDLTRLDGILNLGAHHPLNGIAPDLGVFPYIGVYFLE